MLLVAVGEGVHVGVVDQGVVSISPRELLRVRERDVREASQLAGQKMNLNKKALKQNL